MNKEKTNSFRTQYERNLRKCMGENPNYYLYGEHKIPEVVDGLMRTITGSHGIRAVRIDTPAFIATAKSLKVRNTYGAWERFFEVEPI